jgi:hypothetical protein
VRLRSGPNIGAVRSSLNYFFFLPFFLAFFFAMAGSLEGWEQIHARVPMISTRAIQAPAETPAP